MLVKCVHVLNCFYDHHCHNAISVSFTEILMSYGSSVRSWILEPRTPTDSTGTPEHKKNHLDEVELDLALQLIKIKICVI